MSASAITAAAGLEDSPGASRAWAVASVLAAMVLVVLDAAIANVALPTIGRSLHVAPASAVRVVTAYQLGLVMMLLPVAALGESIGFRRVFVAGSGMFVLASVLCALSPSLPWLVAARFVQGIGGAAIMALGIALLRFIVPHERLGSAIGWNALTVALSSAAGPTLGAAILSIASWPWLFAVNLPVGLAVLAAARHLPKVQGTSRAVDLTSIGLNACVFLAFVAGSEFVLSNPSLAISLVIAAMILVAVLVRREVDHPAPLIPIDLMSSASFRVSIAASVLCFAGQSAALVALPFHLQHTLQLTPLMTGIYLTPWPLTVALAGPFAGRLSSRISTATLCLTGGLCLAAGLGLSALISSHGHWLPFSLCMMLCGLGFGLFNVPNNRNMLLSAPRERSGAAGGLQGMARLTGQTAGALMMTLLFSLSELSVAPRIGLAIGAVLTAGAGTVSLLRAHRAVCE
ncbi:MAG: MFS transporter [Rhizomicrobium sp.]